MLKPNDEISQTCGDSIDWEKWMSREELTGAFRSWFSHIATKASDRTRDIIRLEDLDRTSCREQLSPSFTNDFIDGLCMMRPTRSQNSLVLIDSVKHSHVVCITGDRCYLVGVG